jgi:hypothetical protein
MAMAAALAGALALAFAGHFIVQYLRPGDYWRAYPWVTSLAVYASALAASAFALQWIAGGADQARLRAAFWLLFTALGAALCFVAPGAAIYFLLPPLAAALGMVGKRWFAWSEQVCGILAALLLYLAFGPALGLFEELMNGGPLWAFAPLAAAIMLPALIELRPLVAQARVPAVLAVIGWVAAGFTPAYSADKQQLFTIEYVWDDTAHGARFAVNNDGAPVPYAAQWTRTEMPYTTRRRWAAPAPALPITPPAVTLVSQAPAPGGRRLTLRLAANGAETIALIAPADTGLREAGNGAFVQRFGSGKASDKYYVRCVGRACDGATIDLVVAGQAPLDLTIVGTRTGLPPLAAPLVRARPPLARPQYGPDATIAIGHARF